MSIVVRVVCIVPIHCACVYTYFALLCVMHTTTCMSVCVRRSDTKCGVCVVIRCPHTLCICIHVHIFCTVVYTLTHTNLYAINISCLHALCVNSCCG